MVLGACIYSCKTSGDLCMAMGLCVLQPCDVVCIIYMHTTPHARNKLISNQVHGHVYMQLLTVLAI